MSTVSINSVSPVKEYSVAEQQELLHANHKPVDLFAESAFVTDDAIAGYPATVVAPGDMSILMVETEEMKVLNQSWQQQSISPESRALINQAVEELTSAIYTSVPTIGAGASATEVASGLTEQYDESLEVFHTHSGHTQRDAATREFMYASLYTFEQDVAEFSLMVQTNTNQARETRTEITELREMLSEWPDEPKDATEEFTYTKVTFNDDGSITTEQVTEHLKKGDAENLLTELEAQKESLSELTELQTFDLQQMAQNLDQARQLVSEILQNQHSTRQAMINNMKA
ncbi:MAG: hypothetical protein AAFP04_01045 [Myxococcota bacterium]